MLGDKDHWELSRRLVTPGFINRCKHVNKGFGGGGGRALQQVLSIKGSLRAKPRGGHGNPLQYSCLENPREQRSLAGYSQWGCRVRHDWVTKHSTAFVQNMWELITLLILLLSPSPLSPSSLFPSPSPLPSSLSPCSYDHLGNFLLTYPPWPQGQLLLAVSSELEHIRGSFMSVTLLVALIYWIFLPGNAWGSSQL